MYVNSLSTTEYISKNYYSSRRRENDSEHIWYIERYSSQGVAKKCAGQLSKFVKDISLQVLNDFGDICGNNFNLAVGNFLSNFVSYFIRNISEKCRLTACLSFQWDIRRKWNLESVVLNVTYVEQKQRDMAVYK